MKEVPLLVSRCAYEDRFDAIIHLGIRQSVTDAEGNIMARLDEFMKLLTGHFDNREQFGAMRKGIPVRTACEYDL